MENISTYEFLKKNIYNKPKRKLFLYPIKVDYEIISHFLLNPKILMDFFQNEIKNIFFQTPFLNIINGERNNKMNIGKDYNIFIIPNDNPDKMNDLYKVKSIFSKHYINHSLLILRFIKEETFDFKNINDNNNSKLEQILDMVISFYIDINDNSTLLINEIYSNLDDHLYINFIKFTHLFYQKLNGFIHQKLNKFYCFESILIQKNMQNIFDFLYSCKIFHNEKFQIKKIEKYKGYMEISCIIGSLFPVNNCEAKLCIRSLSNNLCLVEIENWMNASSFDTQEKLLNIKSIILLFLKKLKSKINNEYCILNEKK